MTGLCNVVLLACVLPAGSLLGAAPPAAVRARVLNFAPRRRR